MVDVERIEAEIEKRMMHIEKEVDERLGSEEKGKHDLVRYVYRVRNRDIMSDLEFYKHMKLNNIAVEGEELTKDLAVAKVISKIRNRFMQQMHLPQDISDADLKSLLNNKRLNGLLQNARTRVVKILTRTMQSYEATRRKLIEKLQEEEYSRIDPIIEAAHKKVVEAEKLEWKLARVLSKLRNQTEKSIALEQKMIEQERRRTYTFPFISSLNHKISKHLKILDTLDMLTAEQEEIENKIDALAQEVQNILNAEFGGKVTVSRKTERELERV